MGRIFRYVHTASTLDCFLRLGGPEINERLSPGSHPLPHAIPTRTTSIMSAEKPGLPGSHPVTMPLRQTSTSSAMSDDAVPLTDPKNVSPFADHPPMSTGNKLIRIFCRLRNSSQSVCKHGNTQ